MGAALLTECGQLEPRARELILLVKRWAKDRGICHAAKGHLSPYSWTLLCIFFLQVREEPMLPPLDRFKKSSALCGTIASKNPSDRGVSETCVPQCAIPSIATLLKQF